MTDPGIVKALLTVLQREDYWYVTCGTCGAGWQTPFYAAKKVS